MTSGEEDREDVEFLVATAIASEDGREHIRWLIKEAERDCARIGDPAWTEHTNRKMDMLRLAYREKTGEDL